MSAILQTDSISNVRDCIARAASRTPEKIALIGDNGPMSYGELDKLSSHWAARLAGRGIQPRDHIAVVAGNSASLVAALFGAWKLGVVVHHHNPATRHDVLCQLLRESNTRALIVDQSDAFLGEGSQLLDPTLVILETQDAPSPSTAEARPAASTADVPDELACVSYTSGSTGIPCGVELSHRYLIGNAELNIDCFQIAADDRVLLTLPLFFGMNRTTLLAYLMAGATIILPQTATTADDFIRLIDRHNVTSLSIVPSIAHQLTAAAFAKQTVLTSLHSLRIGAGAITREMLDRLSAVFPKARFSITYGLTEIGLVSVVLPDEIDAHFMSCGRAVEGVSLRVQPSGDDNGPPGSGEVIVSAAHQAMGYAGASRNANEVFHTDGIHTGDLGFLDDEGFLFLCGRSKELIKTAGVSVAPREVEEVIEKCPGVEEAVVLGVPNRWLGEALVAAVRPSPGRNLQISDLYRHCTEFLHAVKRPQSILLVEQFPRTPNGKADRKELTVIVRRAIESAGAAHKTHTPIDSPAKNVEGRP